MTHTKTQRTSEILSELLEAHRGESITLGEMMESLSSRGFGIGILIFALPNTPPLGIPGLSSLCALPIIFFAFQMLLGRKKMWLPAWVAQKSFSPRTFSKAISITIPWLRRIEKIIKPRARKFTGLWMERATGLMIMILAAVIFLPIPGGNFMPAICMCLLAIGFLEKDGAMILLSYIFSIIVLTIMSTIIFTVLHFVYMQLIT